MVRREESCLPHRTFVAFAIALETEYAMRLGVELGRVGHACRHGEPVTQRSRGELHPGHAPVRNVPTQDRTVLIVRCQDVGTEESGLRERSINACASVSFAQDEPTSLGPLRRPPSEAK